MFSVTRPRHFHHRSNNLYLYDLISYCNFCSSKGINHVKNKVYSKIVTYISTLLKSAYKSKFEFSGIYLKASITSILIISVL